MKKISVIIKDKTILELTENACVGDIIDLRELTKIDMSFIENLINSGKEDIYKSKFEDAKKVIESQHAVQLGELQKQIELLRQEKLSEIDKLSAQNKFEIEMARQEEREKLAKYIGDLKVACERATANAVGEIEKVKLEAELQKEKELNEQKEMFHHLLEEKEERYLALQRQKSNMNVKQTGEDLEAWCDNEVSSYMQNGLFNCTWIKDNQVVRNEGDIKGSKADYIFNVYASDKHIPDELLASVCMDMKDENPESKQKKTNASYYAKLEENRIKKNCKYSVLVSNLEMDKPNILPIFKVREYENMYVVRPAYLMVFLNMITSLTTRFGNLLISKEKEMIELKDKATLIEQFDDIKNTYLDKPLDLLQKELDNILESSEAIKKASCKIDASCDKIIGSYINKIQEKLAKFEIKLSKTVNSKLD